MPEEPVILYVEDNPENRMLIRRILLAEGFTVVECPGAQPALEKVKTLVPDLILMDINMPDMDGYTLSGIIKQDPRFARVPIIALTANVMRGDKERILSAGFDGYIQKPVDVDDLPVQINRILKEVGRG
jgi:two-component system cell cycle response regulator DivK